MFQYFSSLVFGENDGGAQPTAHRRIPDEKRQKLKNNLQQCCHRINIVMSKKSGIIKQQRRQVAELLAGYFGMADGSSTFHGMPLNSQSLNQRSVNSLQTAKIRVESLINDDRMMEVLEILQLLSEVLVNRLGMLDVIVYSPSNNSNDLNDNSSLFTVNTLNGSRKPLKQCHPSIREPIHTLIFASPHLQQTLKELPIILTIFQSIYGKKFIDEAMKGNFVNEKVQRALLRNSWFNAGTGDSTNGGASLMNSSGSHLSNASGFLSGGGIGAVSGNSGDEPLVWQYLKEIGQAFQVAIPDTDPQAPAVSEHPQNRPENVNTDININSMDDKNQEDNTRQVFDMGRKPAANGGPSVASSRNTNVPPPEYSSQTDFGEVAFPGSIPPKGDNKNALDELDQPESSERGSQPSQSAQNADHQSASSFSASSSAAGYSFGNDSQSNESYSGKGRFGIPRYPTNFNPPSGNHQPAARRPPLPRATENSSNSGPPNFSDLAERFESLKKR